MATLPRAARVFLAVMALASGATGGQGEDGLVARLPLDGQGVDVVGGLHATVVGATPAPDRQGRAGGALAFDGKDDHLDLPRPLGCGTGPLSITVWARQEPGSGRGVVLGNYPGRRAFNLEIDRGRPRVYWNDGQVDLTGDASLENLGDGSWHHLAMVRDPAADRITLHVDGFEVAQGKVGDDLTWDQGHRIGFDHRDDAALHLKGALDELCVHRAVLSPETLLRLAHAEATAVREPVRAEWAAFWTLDGHGDDVNSGRASGLLEGGPQPAEDRFGRAGRALAFDGQDDRIVLLRPLDAGTGASSWMVWVKLAPGRDRAVILGSYPRSGCFNWEVSEGRPRVYWDEGAVDFQGAGGAVVHDGAWHHLAMVRDPVADRITLYVDGDPVGTGPAGKDLHFAHRHALGADHRGGSSVHFQGAMDDLVVVRRALTGAEVLAEAARGAPPPEPPPRPAPAGRAAEKPVSRGVRDDLDTSDLEAELTAIVRGGSGDAEAIDPAWSSTSVIDRMPPPGDEDGGSARDGPEPEPEPAPPEPGDPQPGPSAASGAPLRPDRPLPEPAEHPACSGPPRLATPTFGPAAVIDATPPEFPPGLERIVAGSPEEQEKRVAGGPKWLDAFTGIHVLRRSVGDAEQQVRGGKPDGLFRLVAVRPDGQRYVSQARYQKDGKGHGPALDWDRDGSLNEVAHLRNGRRSGPYYHFQGGVVWQEGYYLDGHQHGDFSTFERGRLKVWECHDHGKGRAFRQFRLDDGSLEVTRSFDVAGHKRDETWWTKDGRPQWRDEFDEGERMLRRIHYDEAGQVRSVKERKR